MPKQQRRLDDRARLVPISLYSQTIAQLEEIQRASGESRGATVRRLVEREAERLRRQRIPRAPVWIFPSYRATSSRIDARVVYRARGAEDRIFEADGHRVLPEPPIGSYVVIDEGTNQLRGQVENVETTDVDGSPVVVITVRSLVPSAAADVPPLLFDFVHRLNAEITSRSSVDILFDPHRTTPSWKLGENEVRAMLIGPAGQRAVQIRFLPFSGPTFQDHLNPLGYHLPIIDVDDDIASADAAERIVTFLQQTPQQPGATEGPQKFSQWVEAVYLLIHAELGGDALQSGQSRRFGKALFGCAMDYKPEGDRGVVQFVVTITHGLRRGRRRTERCPWRTTSAATVAYDALRNYKQLLEDD